MSINHLDNGWFTGQNCLKIAVINAEHHGKVELHDHSFYELVYIDKGFAMHTCDDNNMVLTSGDLFLIVPGQAHSYLGAYHTKLYNCLFMPDAIKAEFPSLSLLPGLREAFGNIGGDDKWHKLSLDLNERQQVVRYLDKMRWEGTNKPIGWELKMKSLLIELLVFYSRVYSSRVSVKTENPYMQYVYRALEYINDNCDKDFFIKDIADYVGISPDYLTKHFKIILGIPPMEYVKTFRISRAMELLKQTDKPVAVISSEIGFSDISHFSRQFKQVTGSSPSAFRKENI